MSWEARETGTNKMGSERASQGRSETEKGYSQNLDGQGQDQQRQQADEVIIYGHY